MRTLLLVSLWFMALSSSPFIMIPVMLLVIDHLFSDSADEIHARGFAAGRAARDAELRGAGGLPQATPNQTPFGRPTF